MGEGNQSFLDRSKGNASLVEVINGTPSSISSVFVRDVARLINLFCTINRCSIGYNNTQNKKRFGEFVDVLFSHNHCTVLFRIGKPDG